MNEEKVLVITDKQELYDKCENMEQLFNKYYLPLLDTHYRKTYQLQQENKQLKERLNKYEDPEDLTLMFMYCDGKAKDKIKQLQEQLQQRDEVIEEAKKYIKNNTRYFDPEFAKIYGELCTMAGAGDTRVHVVLDDERLLDILNKGDNNE